MPYRLHIPGEPSRTLRWTTSHPASSYGSGVLLYRNSKDMLDGATFRMLRDARGAWLETDHPGRARSALALLQNESLGNDQGVAGWEIDPRPLGECLKEWHGQHGWTRDQAAAELRAPRSTYDGWCAGRPAALDASIRRLMSLIDAQSRA